MRIRQLCAALTLVGLIACESKIHRLLEAPRTPDVRLGISVQPSSLTLPRGGEVKLTATVVRVGDGGGPASVMVEGVPPGVTVNVVTTVEASGATASISIRASDTARVGNYSMTVRGKANDATDGTSLLVLSVIDPPDVAVTLSQPSITIARGGIARLGVTLVRTNLSAPIALSVSGASGISAVFPGSPIAGNSVEATISADAGIAPGTYPVAVRASADGVDRSATLTVNVIADPLQVIVGDGFTTPQLSTVSREIIVNRAASVAAVSLSAEGLPAGVSAAFQPLTVGARTTSVSFTIAGTTTPGTYAVAIRASANGVPDATASLSVTVTAASIALALSPTSSTLPAGRSTETDVSITRRDFVGPVNLDVVSPPTGITVSFDSASIRGNRAKATVVVAGSVTPGQYAVTIRATPVQLAATAAQTSTLALTVASQTSASSVVLDWSGCTTPTWVGLQDGNGSWTRLTSSNNLYIGSVASPVGAIAYVIETNVFVRYLTQAELTAGPLKLCAPSATRLVRGIGGHAPNGADVSFYSLGGGFATSSYAQPNFSIAGVRDGVHDLVATMTFTAGAVSRILIRRDIPATATSLDSVTVLGSEGFPPVMLSPTVTATGPMMAGETFSSSSSLMTTAACTVNPIRSLQGFTATVPSGPSVTLSLFGIPASSMRPDDYYLASASITGPNTSRTATVAFHNLEARTLFFAPLLAVPTVTELSGAYKRLQVNVGALSQTFNRTVSLQYGDSRGTISVLATRSFFEASGGIIATPDLSGASGWPAGAGVPSASTGTWRLVAEGSTSEGSACVENRMTFTSSRSGSY
ncbi:MAG TPA: hypothetical protein VIP11_24630 [Gemmatimonadaceae bacterium]